MATVDAIIRRLRGALTTRAARALLWSAVGRALGQVLRLGLHLVFARLLFPESFGLMAIVLTIATMLQLASDTGIRTTLVQNARGDHPLYLNTAFSIGVLRGLLLMTIMLIAAWPVAAFYNDSRLILLMMLAAPGLLIAGLENPGLSLLWRRLDARRLTTIEFLGDVSGSLATLALVFLLGDARALALGYTVSQACRVLLSHVLCAYSPRFAWDGAVVRDFYGFGKYIFINTICSYAVMNLDLPFAGKWMAVGALGAYAVGRNLLLAGEQMLSHLVSRVYFPGVCESIRAGAPREFERRFDANLGRVAFYGGLTALPFVLGAGFFIELLYDPRYALASLALFWFGLRLPLRLLSFCSCSVLLAAGKPEAETRAQLFGFGVLTVLYVLISNVTATELFFHLLGLAGIAVALAILLCELRELSRVFGGQRFRGWSVRALAALLPGAAAALGGFVGMSFTPPGAWSVTALCALAGIALAYIIIHGPTETRTHKGELSSCMSRT